MKYQPILEKEFLLATIENLREWQSGFIVPLMKSCFDTSKLRHLIGCYDVSRDLAGCKFYLELPGIGYRLKPELALPDGSHALI